VWIFSPWWISLAVVGAFHIGEGKGKGRTRAKDAILEALKHPLLQIDLSSAKAIFLHIRN